MVYMAFVAAAALVVACASGVSGDGYGAMFEEFKTAHRRVYASAAEERARYANFVANMERAAELNRANPHARFGANEFADYSEEETRRMRGQPLTRRRPASTDAMADSKAGAPALQKDWRKDGVVTPVKDQGNCSAGWSFATTGNIEGQWALAGNKLVSLSEQFLVSCDTLNEGCTMGNVPMANANILAIMDGRMVTEASVPYTGGKLFRKACEDMSQFVTGAKISASIAVPSNELAMSEFVAVRGPLAVAVNSHSWLQYTNGVKESCDGLSYDHWVLIVGFDALASPPYWIIKNSWGSNWGEQGYIRLKMWQNLCAIASVPTTALIF